MIILSQSADLIRFVTTSANALDVHASYIDNLTLRPPYTPGRQNTAIAAAATTTVLGAPPAATQRKMMKLTANARGGANTVTVEYFDGTTAFRVLSVSLLSGETIEYEDATGWVIHDSVGAIRTTGVGPGRLLRAPQYLTAGTTINHPAGTATIVIRGVGGGGAGGGVNAAAQAIGACGGSGTYGERSFAATAASSTYVVGAAGVGVSGAAGGNGTASTFTHGATTVTLPFGTGGGVAAGAAAIKAAVGGAGGGAPTNADLGINGQMGGDAVNTTAPIFSAHADGGGSTPYGQGGAGNVTIATQIAGNAGTGFGSGGSGALNGTTATALAGANGAPGVWVVEEYS